MKSPSSGVPVSPGARQGATRDVCDVGYVAYKPYQYIDLSADEAVAKRRWPSSASRDSNGHGGAGTISRDYVYIDRGQEAPAQQYRFLDVCAEELRGTFLTPAHSEQRLLYSESPWRLTVYDYSCPAHFLPPGGVGSARRLPRTPQLDQAVGLVSGQGPPAVADTTMRARAPRAGGSPAAPAPATPRQQYRHGGATSQGAQTFKGPVTFRVFPDAMRPHEAFPVDSGLPEAPGPAEQLAGAAPEEKGKEVAVVHVVEEATVEVVAGFQPVGDQGQTRAPMRPPIARKLFHNDHERDEAAAGPSAPPPSEETASPGRDEVRAIPTAAKSGTPPPRAPSAGRRAHRGPVTSGGLQQERQHYKAKRQRMGQDGQEFFTYAAPVQAPAPVEPAVQQQPRRHREPAHGGYEWIDLQSYEAQVDRAHKGTPQQTGRPQRTVQPHPAVARHAQHILLSRNNLVVEEEVVEEEVVEEEVVIEEHILLPPEPSLAMPGSNVERGDAEQPPASEEQDGSEDEDGSGVPTLLPFVPRPSKTMRSGPARPAARQGMSPTVEGTQPPPRSDGRFKWPSLLPFVPSRDAYKTAPQEPGGRPTRQAPLFERASGRGRARQERPAPDVNVLPSPARPRADLAPPRRVLATADRGPLEPSPPTTRAEHVIARPAAAVPPAALEQPVRREAPPVPAALEQPVRGEASLVPAAMETPVRGAALLVPAALENPIRGEARHVPAALEQPLSGKAPLDEAAIIFEEAAIYVAEVPTGAEGEPAEDWEDEDAEEEEDEDEEFEQAEEDGEPLDVLEVLEFEVPVLVVPATAAAQLPETLVVEQRMHPSSTPSALPPEMPAETPEPVIGSGWDQADQQEVSRMRGQAPKDKTVQTSWDEGPQGAAQQLPVSSRTPAAAQAVREAVATSSPTQETAGSAPYQLQREEAQPVEELKPMPPKSMPESQAEPAVQQVMDPETAPGSTRSSFKAEAQAATSGQEQGRQNMAGEAANCRAQARPGTQPQHVPTSSSSAEGQPTGVSYVHDPKEASAPPAASVKVQIVVCGDRLAGREQQSAWPAFAEQAGGAAAEQELQAKPVQGLLETTRTQQQQAPAVQPSKREGSGTLLDKPGSELGWYDASEQLEGAPSATLSEPQHPAQAQGAGRQPTPGLAAPAVRGPISSARMTDTAPAKRPDTHTAHQGTAREPVSSTEEASEESVRTTQELCHPPPPISASSKGVNT